MNATMPTREEFRDWLHPILERWFVDHGWYFYIPVVLLFVLTMIQMTLDITRSPFRRAYSRVMSPLVAVLAWLVCIWALATGDIVIGTVYGFIAVCASWVTWRDRIQPWWRSRKDGPTESEPEEPADESVQTAST